MATIQIKRNNSNAATKPSSLLVGELAGNLLDRSLFSSDGSNVFQFYTGTTKWFDTSGNANNANKLGGTAASSYATQTWIENKKYLTTHQSIYSLTINNSAGTAQVTYTPNSKAASLTLTKSMVGLSNVENTALSTWAGSAKITTLGTITSGTWNGTKIANGYLANSSMTIAGTSVSLGGSITAATLKTNLGLGSLAYKSSLVASDIPSLDWSKITSGKPTTAAGYGIADALTFTNNGTYVGANMPSSGLSNLAASAYIECWDGAGWWNWKAAKWITVGGTSSHFVKGDGTLDATTYLPLSGGTMTGAIVIGGYTSFGVSDGIFYLGNPSYPVYVRSNGIVNINGNAVIHAGNIGSYSLKIDGSNLMTGYVAWNNGSEGNDVADWNTIRGNGLKIISSSTSTSNAPSAYATALHVKGRYGFQLTSIGGDTDELWFKNISRENRAWKHIAFTDSNVASATQVMVNYSYNQDVNYPLLFTSRDNIGVAKNGSLYTDYYGKITYNPQKDVLTVGNVAGNTSSATKLQTARTIWGQSFDGTANVSGVLTLPANHQIQWVNSNSMIYGNGSNITISNTGNLAIATSGNVLIGAATDSGNGAKLQVSGLFSATGDGVFGSDARYKSKLQDLVVDIETIANAPVFSYKWTDREDDKVHLGTTAQYWLPTKFCDAVDTSNPNFYHLNYGALGVAIGVTIAKEQIKVKSEVERLRERVKELENQIKQLKQWHN